MKYQQEYKVAALNDVLDFIASRMLPENNSSNKSIKAYAKLFTRLNKVYQREHSKLYSAKEV